MLICIDAGHFLGTPGKRCLKSIDPNETREWVLNSRIADLVQEYLRDYRCETMRADDISGEKNIGLSSRVAAANRAEADVYLSIHHNAGICGGSGGGIVIYTAKNPKNEGGKLQEAVYRHTVANTGLRGNRAVPLGQADYYVLKHTQMPAVLGEFGFMDSTTDTPVILTREFAEQTAQGIVAALKEIYALEERELTQEEIRLIVRQEMEKMEAERAVRTVSPWAEAGLREAKEKGITDATRPQSYATRQEVALMINAAIK